MRRILKSLLVALPYLWNGIQCLVRYLGDADFIIQRTQDPAWFGAMIEYLVKPAPALVQLAVFAFGGLMLYLLYIRNKATRVVQAARQTDSTINDFKKYVRQYAEHICDLIDIWLYDKDYRYGKEDADIDKGIIELEGRYKDTMEQMETLAGKCGIRRFLLRLKNPTEYASDSGATTLEIISWDDAKAWVMLWFDFINAEDKKKLKDKVREAAHEQQKGYLKEYAHQLTQKYYEATPSQAQASKEKARIIVEVDKKQIKLFKGRENYEIHMSAGLYNNSKHLVSARLFLRIGNEMCQTTYNEEPWDQGGYILLEAGRHVQKPLSFWFSSNPSELDSKLTCLDSQDNELFEQSIKLPYCEATNS